MVRYLFKLFLYITLLISPFIFGNIAFAEESIKINSINFDNSDSIIFLGTSSNADTVIPNITKKVLKEPDRIYFDIENAVTTFQNTTYELKNSRLTKVKIAQNSTAPDIVRIVIWSSDGYDTSQIKVLNIKNNIIIKLGNELPLQQYLTQVYKETKDSAIEYYDKAVVIMEGKKTEEADEIFNSVQKAFSIEGQELVRPNIEQKQARLKSRFFLEKLIVNNGDVSLTGIGVINMEKPFTLTEPDRIVFDLPNTIVLQELRDKEFKLSPTETVKIGQFEPSKARIVIKSDTPGKYKAIYSSNLQTLLITKNDNIIPSDKTELSSFKDKPISKNTNEINMIFTNPVIYSIKKENNKLNVYLYNLTNFNINEFNEAALKSKSGILAEKTNVNNYIISFPINYSDLVDCYEALNAEQLRFVITKSAGIEQKEPPSEITKKKKTIELGILPLLDRQKKKNGKTSKKQKKSEKNIIIDKINKKVIIIDPGHGGNDTGAMRNNVLEKNLTLEIALKVRDCLQDEGITSVIMTRSSDKTLTLDERVQMANVNNASIFVSIHINASVKSEIHGIETHYYTESGYNLAKLMHKELMDNINAVDRGLFKSKFYVIKNTDAPAVLLELGFISNENERNSLQSEERQNKSAKAIAEGIIKFLTEHLDE